MADLRLIGDLDEVPVPRADVVIRQVTGVGWCNKGIVRVEVKVAPFLPVDRPSLVVRVFDGDDRVVGEVAVVEMIQRECGVLIHVRGEVVVSEGWYVVVELLYGAEDVVQHSARCDVVWTVERGD